MVARWGRFGISAVLVPLIPQFAIVVLAGVGLAEIDGDYSQNYRSEKDSKNDYRHSYTSSQSNNFGGLLINVWFRRMVSAHCGLTSIIDNPGRIADSHRSLRRAAVPESDAGEAGQSCADRNHSAALE